LSWKRLTLTFVAGLPASFKSAWKTTNFEKAEQDREKLIDEFVLAVWSRRMLSNERDVSQL
jgi:hypothetical protein